MSPVTVLCPVTYTQIILMLHCQAQDNGDKQGEPFTL